MGYTKEQALKNRGFDFVYDIRTDTIVLRHNAGNMGTSLHPVYASLTINRGDYDKFTVNEIVDYYNRNAMELDSYMHAGVTSKQLRDPRIKQAYEELQILIKLIGL